MLKLNLGCGKDVREGWINIDKNTHYSGTPDLMVWDLESVPLPISDNSVQIIHASHILEHIHALLPLMQDLWRVACPGATMVAWVPYGNSDVADEDPTHVRRFFAGSFKYFSPGAYARADYGYRGDWKIRSVTYRLDESYCKLTLKETMKAINSLRNTVQEFHCLLEAIKPARINPPEDKPNIFFTYGRK